MKTRWTRPTWATPLWAPLCLPTTMAVVREQRRRLGLITAGEGRRWTSTTTGRLVTPRRCLMSLLRMMMRMRMSKRRRKRMRMTRTRRKVGKGRMMSLRSGAGGRWRMRRLMRIVSRGGIRGYRRARNWRRCYMCFRSSHIQGSQARR
ncbi:hypothetical protein GE09DRAFT_446757 [Coniochaeta sp. 2T2.1]|nr:hypothetical protein GE09DRAFT_446757 [Coniochaeta sp. 2T2.1]